MNSMYGKLTKNVLICMALTNLVLVSMLVFADNDFESLSPKSRQSFGYSPQSFDVEKKLSEFLGGPGKRSDYDYYYNSKSKRLSEFLGGPGKKRFSPPRDSIEKRLSEFLGGPGK